MKNNARDRLVAHLREHGLNLSDLARSLGREPQSLYRTLSGKQTLQIEPWVIFEGCDALGLDPRFVCGLIRDAYNENATGLVNIANSRANAHHN